MWLLRGFGAGEDSSGADVSTTAELDEEAADLKAKLEAMRAAEYREQMRASCAAREAVAAAAADADISVPAVDMSFGGSSGSHDDGLGASPDDIPFAEHYSLGDDSMSMAVHTGRPGSGSGLGGGSGEIEINDMYDFDRFLPGAGPRSPSSSSSRSSPSRPAAAEMERRSPVQPPAVAPPLTNGSMVDASDGFAQAAASNCQDEGAAEHEEQLLELARIAEELTDALETAREGEARATARCSQVSAQLEAARSQATAALEAQRAAERELEQTQAGAAAEVTTLRNALMERDRLLESQAARLRELEVRNSRIELELGLSRALTKKGSSLRFRHLEV